MDTGFRRYDEFIYLRYYIEFFYIENRRIVKAALDRGSFYG